MRVATGIQISWGLLLVLSTTLSHGQSKSKCVYVPEIVGKWWNITGNPDLGIYNSPKQQQQDFGVWQATDGTWQLWSCIRGTKAGGFTRLFYRWEAKSLQDSNWMPKGIAMEADTSLGEAKSGLQAPFVLKENKTYYMFYGDWNRICMARSIDGKHFERILNSDQSPAIFSGPMANTRDPMVLKTGKAFYCYYTAHLEKNDPAIQIKTAVFCRKSKDLKTWSEPVMVSSGGTAVKHTGWYGGDAECPFVVKIRKKYILFRNQNYGRDNFNTQYSSSDPLNFGVGNDLFKVAELSVAAPEIIKIKNQYYIIALKPELNGMRVAKLKFVKRKSG